MNDRSRSSPSGVLRPPAWVRGTVRCRRGKIYIYIIPLHVAKYYTDLDTLHLEPWSEVLTNRIVFYYM